MKPLTPGLNYLGTAPQFHAMTGVPQAIASIMTRPKGSGQLIGKSSAMALPRNSDLRIADLSNEFDEGVIQQRLARGSK